MKTLENKCVFASTCKMAGIESHCNFTCYPYAFLHGVEGGSGGLWETTGVPKGYKHCRISNLPTKEDNPKAYAITEKYVENVLTFVLEKQAGLFLYSIPTESNQFGTGTGKTTTAITILNHFTIERSRAYLRGEMSLSDNPAIFVKSTELQNTFNAQFRGSRDQQEQSSEKYYKLKKTLKCTELVVMDDIATRGSRVSEAYEDELYEILDYRATQGVGATIFTSNVNMEELAQCLGDRIASRIAGMTVKVGFTGKDHRQDGLFK